MDKSSILIVFLGILGTTLISIISGAAVSIISTPYFDIQYDTWNRTGCQNLDMWNYNETCPNGEKHVSVDIERIVLENTGLVQAKNVDLILDIIGDGNGHFRQVDCPEGIILDDNMFDTTKIEFQRFSQDITCKFDFESLSNSRIEFIIVTADDASGYKWNTLELKDQRILSFVWFIIVLILLLIVSLAYVIYSGYVLVQDLILKKRLNYPKKIKSLSCDLRFETQISDNIEHATLESVQKRDGWITKIKQISTIIMTTKKENCDEIILKLKNEDIVIRISNKTTIQNRGNKFVASNLNVTTTKIKTLQKLLDIGEHPCWTFYWHLYNQFDVENFVDMVKIHSRKSPSSSSSMSRGAKTIITNATYNLLDLDSGTIRTVLSQGTDKEGGKIGIIHDGQENKGFQNVSALSLKKIIYMTYGAISVEKSLKLLTKVCNKKKYWKLKSS